MTRRTSVSIASLGAYSGIWPITAVIVVLMLRHALANSPIARPELFEGFDSDKNGQLTAAEIPPGRQRLFTRLLRRGDANQDQALQRDEFEAALVPDRPEKPIEVKQPATFPQANAVRWLLLTMDANGNARLERSEAAEELQRVFDAMANRVDTNKNGILETIELTRGGPPIAQIAGRYVQQNGIDVAGDLKQLEEQQGAAAHRFEARPLRFNDLPDPQKAGQLFVQLDTNNSGQIESDEVPQPLQRPIQRLMRMADRNGDGRLSEREFLAGVRRLGGRMARQQSGEMPAPDAAPTNER